MTTAPRRIGVIGSGVAGLTAAYVASRTAHVTLFEADDRLGGHADTHVVAVPRGRPPDRHRLHRAQPAHLPDAAAPLRRARHRHPALRDVAVGLRPGHRRGVRRRPGCRAGSSRPGPLSPPPPTGGCSPRSRASTGGLAAAGRAGDVDHATRRCGTSSTDGGFSDHFVRHFMEPLVAAVWSCDPETSLDYPARYLFTFLEHHGMLGVFGSPEWRTVTGGSRDVRRRRRRPPAVGPHRHQGHLGAASSTTGSRSPTATAASTPSTRSSSPLIPPRR